MNHLDKNDSRTDEQAHNKNVFIMFLVEQSLVLPATICFLLSCTCFS